ncbi:hypothetical protein KY289_011332 [Solanum tuberosum]|nr:hypothetical protein KY289_011332 [Solanum tuberosum]
MITGRAQDYISKRPGGHGGSEGAGRSHEGSGGTGIPCIHCGYKGGKLHNKINKHNPVRANLQPTLAPVPNQEFHKELAQMILPGLYNGKVLGIGKEMEGLYLLKEIVTPTTNVVSFKHQEEGVLWHLKLGHPSSTVMHHIPSISKYVSNNIQEKCHICPLAKHHSKLPRSDRFAARAKKVVLVGYSETQKGYKLYDLEDKIFFVNRDVDFRESIFPFKIDATSDLDMFSITPIDHFIPANALSSLDIIEQPQPLPDLVENMQDDTLPDPTLLPDEVQDTTLVEEEVHGPPLVDIEVQDATVIDSTSAAPDHSGPVRATRPPIWLSDYVSTSKPKWTCFYPISQHVSYDNLSPTYQMYLANVSIPTEPTSFKMASQDPR